MGQKRSTLSARSQEFLFSLTKLSYQKTATSLIFYWQSGEWRKKNSSAGSPWCLPLFSHATFTFFNAPPESVAPAFLKEMDKERSLWQTASAPQSLPERTSWCWWQCLCYPRAQEGSFPRVWQDNTFSFLVLSCTWSLILLHMLCWPWVFPPCVLWLNDHDWIQLYALPTLQLFSLQWVISYWSHFSSVIIPYLHFSILLFQGHKNILKTEQPFTAEIKTGN